MPLGPEDVVRKSFKSSRLGRGYDQVEVDAFLEEIVADLRRREVEREDLLYRASRAAVVSPGDGSARIAMEREQLDIVRTEREALVDEMRSLASKIEAVTRQLTEADERLIAVQAATTEAEARREHAVREGTELERDLERVRVLHRELCHTYESMAADIHELLEKAQMQAGAPVGVEPRGSTGKPLDDIHAIRDLALKLYERADTPHHEATNREGPN